MPNRPNPGEDYLFGSSDRPNHGDAPATMKPSLGSLEQKLQGMTGKSFDSRTEQLDVGKTNVGRLAYAERQRLGPSVLVSGKRQFRRVTYDAQGLVTFSYSSSIPDRLEMMHPTDGITETDAMQYLGVDKETFKQMVVEGRVTHLDVPNNQGVWSLIDLNRIKFEEQAREE